MRARYYNSKIRRFINQDIVIGSIENSQSLNRYAYCQGNPVNYLDPFGLEPCEFFSGLGHSVLNILELIPGIGDVFDIANAIWYFSEGKVGRDIEAGIAALPFIGNFFPNTRMFNYTKRVLNIVSYGGTACLAGQGMISGGQALWAEINSGHCSGWSIALGIANIGLNGMAFFLSGKGLVRNVKELDYLNMTYIAQKAKWSDIDGGPELTKLLEDIECSSSYYFRGTTEGYAGNSALQRLGITPTSTDPLVSTVFAVNGEQYGKGVLYICSTDDLKGVSYTASNVLSDYEKEVCFNMQPLEFANRASISISASDARNILKDMGYYIPSRITNGNLSSFLSNAPSLSVDEIRKFVEKARGMQ